MKVGLVTNYNLKYDDISYKFVFYFAGILAYFKLTISEINFFSLKH